MKTRNSTLSLLLICGLFMAIPARAEGPTPPAPSSGAAKKPERKIKIDFGSDELVKGDYERPDFDMINSQSGQGFKKMIKVRDKFVDEVEKTRDDFNAK